MPSTSALVASHIAVASCSHMAMSSLLLVASLRMSAPWHRGDGQGQGAGEEGHFISAGFDRMHRMLGSCTAVFNSHAPEWMQTQPGTAACWHNWRHLPSEKGRPEGPAQRPWLAGAAVGGLPPAMLTTAGRNGERPSPQQTHLPEEAEQCQRLLPHSRRARDWGPGCCRLSCSGGCRRGRRDGGGGRGPRQGGGRVAGSWCSCCHRARCACCLLPAGGLPQLPGGGQPGDGSGRAAPLLFRPLRRLGRGQGRKGRGPRAAGPCCGLLRARPRAAPLRGRRGAACCCRRGSSGSGRRRAVVLYPVLHVLQHAVPVREHSGLSAQRIQGAHAVWRRARAGGSGRPCAVGPRRAVVRRHIAAC